MQEIRITRIQPLVPCAWFDKDNGGCNCPSDLPTACKRGGYSGLRRLCSFRPPYTGPVGCDKLKIKSE